MAKVRASNTSGGGGEQGYKECAVWAARQGNANSQVVGVGGTVQNGLRVNGSFIRTDYDNNYLYVKTLSDLQGSIEVEYYATTNGGTPTLQKGTFTANQTIVYSNWTSAYTYSVFAGVLNS